METDIQTMSIDFYRVNLMNVEYGDGGETSRRCDNRANQWLPAAPTPVNQFTLAFC
jgi:hypothetical protein